MSAVFTTAEDAEAAFYDAIGRGDLDALMSVWSDDEDIVCIHPTGRRLSGAAAIRESWRGVFAGSPHLTLHTKRSVCWRGAILAVHSVIEILFVDNEPTPHGPMFSTNVYQRGPNGWRLLSRHTSTGVEADAVELLGEALDLGSRTLH